MKQRDVFALVMIAIVIAIGGWVMTNQFIATEENQSAQIEQVNRYEPGFNEEAVDALVDGDALDFYTDPNLDAGGSDHTLQPGSE